MSNELPAGTYYIGDLCYVFSDEQWEQVCHQCFNDTENKGTLPSGIRYAILDTAYGDGEYEDQYGKNYPVDSGTIGCVLMSDLDPGKFNGSNISEEEFGQVYAIDTSFTPYAHAGLLCFGNVRIDTDADEEEDDGINEFGWYESEEEDEEE